MYKYKVILVHLYILKHACLLTVETVLRKIVLCPFHIPAHNGYVSFVTEWKNQLFNIIRAAVLKPALQWKEPLKHQIPTNISITNRMYKDKENLEKGPAHFKTWQKRKRVKTRQLMIYCELMRTIMAE